MLHLVAVSLNLLLECLRVALRYVQLCRLDFILMALRVAAVVAFTLWTTMITTSEALAVQFKAFAATAVALGRQLHGLQWRY